MVNGEGPPMYYRAETVPRTFNSLIELTDNGIITEDRYERSERVWDVIQRLIRTKRFILVYVSQRQAFVVPKRAFPNDQEWDSFYEILKSHSLLSGHKLNKNNWLWFPILLLWSLVFIST